MSLTTQSAKRRTSFIETELNPFDAAEDGGQASTLLIENLADTVKIERDDLNILLSTLESLSDNAARIRVLHSKKTPYLFSSEDLLKILALTASVKTKIAFISEIGPRLTDPKAKATEIIDMFRYSEEKRQVEEVLKARATTVAKQAAFSKPPQAAAGGRGLAASGRGGGRGGRGGRGFAKGPDSRATVATTTASTPEPEQNNNIISPRRNSGGGFEGSDYSTPKKVTSTPLTQSSSPETHVDANHIPNSEPTSIAASTAAAPASATVGSASSSTNSAQPSIPTESESEVNATTTSTDITNISPPQQIETVVTPSIVNPVPTTEKSTPKQPPPAESTPFFSDVPSPPPIHSLPGRPSRTSKARRSSINAPKSVMDSLGLTGVDDITLDGVPLELWEMKARHSSHAAEVTLEQEDHLRSIALAARKAEYQADEAFRRRQRGEEIQESITISQPFQFETSSQVLEQYEFEEVKSAETITPLTPVPEVDQVQATPSTNSTATPPSSSSSSTTSPVSADPSESEGVIGWVKRRLSFKGDPAMLNELPRSPLPQSQSQSQPHDISDADQTSQPADLPSSSSENPSSTPNVENSVDENTKTETPTPETESTGIIGWVRRRMSTAGPPPETPNGTIHEPSSSPAPVTPPPASRAPETSTPPPAKESTWSGIVRRMSMTPTKPSSDSQTAPTSIQTNLASTPPASTTPGREQRASLQKLLEEKKVGKILGLFENKSSSKKVEQPAVDSKPATFSSPMDDRMSMYVQMMPEDSIGSDPNTGKLLFTYHELVRRNYVKDYTGIVQVELEEHLSDSEFLVRFNMTKEQFRDLPKWRRTERKKNLMLF